MPPVILDTRVVTGAGGGPEKTILNSPRFLEPLGYRMVCAYAHPPNDPGFEILRAKAAKYNAPLVSVPDRGAWDWRVATRMLALCKQERVTVWHGHDYKTNALGLLLKRFWPMRLVTTVHGWVRHTRRTPLYYRIDQLCLPRYERVICVSDDLLEACLAAGVPAKNCVLLENGIDATEYARTRGVSEAKSAIGLPTAEDANAVLVGTPQPAGEDRWLLTDLAGRVVLIDGATGGVLSTQSVGLPGAVPAAPSGVVGASALTTLSDGSAVVIELPKK